MPAQYAYTRSTATNALTALVCRDYLRLAHGSRLLRFVLNESMAVCNDDKTLSLIADFMPGNALETMICDLDLADIEARMHECARYCCKIEYETRPGSIARAIREYA